MKLKQVMVIDDEGSEIDVEVKVDGLRIDVEINGETFLFSKAEARQLATWLTDAVHHVEAHERNLLTKGIATPAQVAGQG